MRTLLLSFILIAGCAIQECQGRIRLTDTSNRWTVIWSGGGTEYYRYFIQYKYGQDTVVNGTTYKRLQAQARQTYYVYPFYIVPAYVNVTNRYLLREDTTLGKVFCFDALTRVETVIYDAAWQIGDSIVTTDPAYPARRLYVRAIDSVGIGSDRYPVFRFSQRQDLKGDDAFAIIEGIGCTSGPWFPASAMKAGGELSWALYCFTHDGMTPPVSPAVPVRSYGLAGNFDNTSSCEQARRLSVPEALSTGLAARVLPIPARAGAVLELSAPLTDARLLIYDATGRILLQQGLQGAQRIPIGQAITHPGLYCWQIIDERSGSRSTGTFIAE